MHLQNNQLMGRLQGNSPGFQRLATGSNVGMVIVQTKVEPR